MLRPSLLSVVLVFGFAFVSHANQNSQITHLTFDDNNGLNSEAIVVGNPTSVQGKHGQALSFDGKKDYIMLGNSSKLSGTGGFTVSAWIKTSKSAYQNIAEQRDTSNGGRYEIEIQSSGKVYFNTFGKGRFGFRLFSNSRVNNGEFRHVVAVREADGTAKIYVDGQLDASKSGSPTDLTPMAVFVGGPNGRLFNGLIDDLRIYNSALSENEVTALFNAASNSEPMPEPMPEPRTLYRQKAE